MRRGVILDAARKLFFERPYQDVSIGDLERECGMTRGPIYYYFENKEEIYASVVVDGLRMVESHFVGLRAANPDPAAFMLALVDEYSDLYTESAAIFDIHFRFFFGNLNRNRVILPQKHNDQVELLIGHCTQILADAIREGTRSGIFRCADPEIATLCIWGLLVTTIQMDTGNDRFVHAGADRARLVAGIGEQILAMLGYAGAR